MCAHRKSSLAITSSLPGPEDIHRKVLSNGITVLCRANFNSPSVSINGYVNAGSLFDPDEKLGQRGFHRFGVDARDRKA